jgi:hypothetical protein
MVEIPKLVLTEIKLSAPAPELLENLRDPTAFTVFKNFGRTPAFLRYSSTNIFVGGRLPPEPDYFNTLTLGPDRIITKGGEYRPDRARIREPLQEQDVHAVMYGRKILWVYGYISYSDFLGELHVAKFCKQFAPPDGGVPNAAWFSGDTPEAYTESY